MPRKKDRKDICKYDNFRVGFTDETGRFNSYAQCDMCGKWHKGIFGLFLDFCVPNKHSNGKTGTGYDGKLKLCSSCAEELAPDLLRIADKLWNRPTPKEDDSELGKKIERIKMGIFESIEVPEDDGDGDDDDI